MASGDELRLNAALLKELPAAPQEGSQPEPTVVLAACLRQLARDFGLAEREDPTFSWVERAGISWAPMRTLNHYFTGNPEVQADDEGVRNGIYGALLRLAEDPKALKSIDKNHFMTSEDLLTFAQIFWNIDTQGERTSLPIRYGQKLSSGAPVRIKVPGADEDFAALRLNERAARTPGYKGEAGAFYARGARVTLLVAIRITDGGEEPPSHGARLHSTRSGRGTEWSIAWPTGAANPPPHTLALGIGPKAAVRRPPGRVSNPPASPGAARTPLDLNLLSAVAEAAHRAGPLPDLSVVTARAGTLDPARFLSGASLNGAEVGQYAVSRRVDIDGEELAIDDVAARLSSEATVGYLIAGAGEGKSTYLHAVSSSLSARAIVFRWRVSGQLDWGKLQNFRDMVESVRLTEGADELPIVVVGELVTKPTREQEDALIEIVQSIPSGLAPPHTSIVLAGRPAWLNRIRRGVSTGQSMRLIPLSETEAGLLIEKLAEAHQACLTAKSPAWIEAHFPNIGRFLSLPPASRLAGFLNGPSLVGSLLHAAYGREFIRRLLDEYKDLEPAEQGAYLLVSLATSSLGGISEELLQSVYPEADIERSSAGSPWQRDIAGTHSARHEMIGRLIVEDKEASTAWDISHAIGRVVDAANMSLEARELLLNSVRILDESRSLIPDQRRKTEPQFRAALRSGILENRESWERLENSIGHKAGEYLAFAYALHRLLPEKLGRDEKTEYLLAHIAQLLEQAEAAASADSRLASQARYRRVLVERDGRRSRGDDVDDLHDVKVLMPMLNQKWPDAEFYAQFLSLGLSTLKHCELDDDEGDQIAEAVLQAWQRLRVEGDIGEQVYAYSTFVARDLYNWPLNRRMSLWEAAWEFSHALANPDGSLACLLDDELIKIAKGKDADRGVLRGRRQRILSESVVPGQDNAEVVLRFAELAGADDETAGRRIAQVARPLAANADAITRSMALHALAISATNPQECLDYLRAALPAYEQSMTSRDDWLTRGRYWKRALRALRGLAPDEASALDARIANAGRRFRT